MTQYTPPTEYVPQPPPPPSPRHHRKWPWIVGAGAVAVIAVAAAAGSGGSSSPAPQASASPSASVAPTPAPPPASRPVPVAPPVATTSQVVYSLMSDADTVSATYGTGPGSQEQANQQTPPWSSTLTVKKADLPYMDVIGQAGSNGSSITCTVSVDGRVVSQHTSTGPYAVVTCLPVN